MCESLKNIFRRQALKRHSCQEDTQLIPLDKINTATVIIDATDSLYSECHENISSFMKAHNIKCNIYYIDLRKMGKDEVLTTSIEKTILLDDFNWYDKLISDKIYKLTDSINRTDLLICLIPDDSFKLEYLVKISTARFKIGVKALPGNPYDISFSFDENTNCLKMFKAISEYLCKIN